LKPSQFRSTGIPVDNKRLRQRRAQVNPWTQPEEIFSKLEETFSKRLPFVNDGRHVLERQRHTIANLLDLEGVLGHFSSTLCCTTPTSWTPSDWRALGRPGGGRTDCHCTEAARAFNDAGPVPKMYPPDVVRGATVVIPAFDDPGSKTGFRDSPISSV
jgi:hypothetical protein